MIWAAVALVLGIVAAAVALAYAGWSEGGIAGILTAVGTLGALLIPVLGKLSATLHETRAQTATIDKIEHQTNGVLDARITTAIDTALKRAEKRQDDAA